MSLRSLYIYLHLVDFVNKKKCHGICVGVATNVCDLFFNLNENEEKKNLTEAQRLHIL